MFYANVVFSSGLVVGVLLIVPLSEFMLSLSLFS